MTPPSFGINSFDFDRIGNLMFAPLIRTCSVANTSSFEPLQPLYPCGQIEVNWFEVFAKRFAATSAEGLRPLIRAFRYNGGRR
jgi:hypothetical protein